MSVTAARESFDKTCGNWLRNPKLSYLQAIKDVKHFFKQQEYWQNCSNIYNVVVLFPERIVCIL